MAGGHLSRNLRQAVGSIGSFPRPQCERAVRFPRRLPHRTTTKCLSTSASRHADIEEIPPERQERFNAAPPIDFDAKESKASSKASLLKSLRVVPASPSYFSAKPTFTDDYISLIGVLKKFATLPTVTPSEAPRVAWKTIDQYRILTNEPVKTLRYHRMLHILRRLNLIHPELMPQEVLDAMKRYKKDVQPDDYKPRPGVIDEMGRAKGVGRRKTSSAVAWLVEGEGEVLINGKTLPQFFGRLHDRESAVWALKSTSRLDKYNLFGLVTGGGVTGQAEALTLAVAKALLVHEPGLKPALRRAGCVTRDPRKVERKKPGHVKARKMPTWVKR